MNGADTRKFVCMTCLKSTEEVYPMSFELKAEYSKLTESVTEDIDMVICNICSWLLRRTVRFKQQCLTARDLLSDALQMDLKSNPIHQITCYPNLKPTTVEVHSYPTTNLQEWKYKNGFNNSETNSPSCNDDDDIDSAGFKNDDDEDEVPLVLLSKSKDDKKKIKRRKSKKEFKTDNIKVKSKTGKVISKSKKAKILRDGFSSRMVQETDEYVVIKLTREQVLKEMQERSKTEAYLQAPFKCEDCVKGFNFQDVLNTHREKHTMENGTFKCDMCAQYCRSAVSLRGHIKSHTTRYKCKLCECVRLSRQHLLEHYAITHTRQPVTYTCNTCPFKTEKRTVMQRHVKSHAALEPHACEQCGNMFKSIDSLRIHTMRHEKSPRLECATCGARFVHRALLRRHAAAAHGAREHYCVECDLHYNSSESLRLHFKKAKKHRDSSANKHECQHCSLRFFTASSLSAHLASAHGSGRAHACSLCRRLYASRDALRAHTWRVHRTDKQTRRLESTAPIVSDDGGNKNTFPVNPMELISNDLDILNTRKDTNPDETNLYQLHNIELLMKVEVIEKDYQFWEHLMEPKLKYFYLTFMLPELCDPRHVRNIPIRDLSALK